MSGLCHSPDHMDQNTGRGGSGVTNSRGPPVGGILHPTGEVVGGEFVGGGGGRCSAESEELPACGGPGATPVRAGPVHDFRVASFCEVGSPANDSRTSIEKLDSQQCVADRRTGGGRQKSSCLG